MVTSMRAFGSLETAISYPELGDQLERLIDNIAACLQPGKVRGGFSPSEWRVLCALASASTVSHVELSVETKETISETSRIMRRLLELGLAEWNTAASNQIAITRRGRELHAALSPQANSETRRAVEVMLNQDLMLAIQLLAQHPPFLSKGAFN